MGTYVIGGAVLFAIGFITYEIIEGVKEAKEALNNAQSQAQPIIIDEAVSGNTLTNPLAAISYAAGGLGSLLGTYTADQLLNQE